ncbi:MAG: type IX secretion system outer membrane channel protein PorV [Bacteroidales bacterium]|nr:type IX secretion system outer membrane channel protein PorV [Bacteroidales bacterium]
MATKTICAILAAALPMLANAQIQPSQNVLGSNNQSNIIQTSASFLAITPDSRAGALGDAGVATSPDVNSQHWNAAKYIFAEDKAGLGLTYTPWLRKYVDDMSISYLCGYNKYKDNQAFGYSVTYFNLGDMTFTDYNGSVLKSFNPKEFCLDGSYALKLADNLSASITMRYIYSNLTGGLAIGGSEETHVGQTIAGDLGVYYQNRKELGEMAGTFAWGVQVSNIGSKIGYTKSNKGFIPTNLKLGVSYKLELDEYNGLMATMDANKLLVPTPPIWNTSHDQILAGKNPDVSVITGIFHSFGDAPGGGSEELKEISYSLGLEYTYANNLSARMGYFGEHKDKGGRKYMTFGVGVGYRAFKFDLAYLVATTESNPLQNTIRLSLAYYFGNSK